MARHLAGKPLQDLCRAGEVLVGHRRVDRRLYPDERLVGLRRGDRPPLLKERPAPAPVRGKQLRDQFTAALETACTQLHLGERAEEDSGRRRPPRA